MQLILSKLGKGQSLRDLRDTFRKMIKSEIDFVSESKFLQGCIQKKKNGILSKDISYYVDNNTYVFKENLKCITMLIGK